MERIRKPNGRLGELKPRQAVDPLLRGILNGGRAAVGGWSEDINRVTETALEVERMSDGLIARSKQKGDRGH